ncbi:hypothetical protein ABZ702_24390 [Streptomyces cyaneofuscatus]|uniref:hypothetical protein n=1 Tax=Streptomyces cyaneofuscatus TaxID=66883 RepID=UPI00340D595D
MNTNRCLPRRAALAATAVAAGLVLAACGSDDSANTPGTAPATTTAPAASETDRHNQADVTFAQGMVPHHRQVRIKGSVPPNLTTLILRNVPG